MIHPLTRLHLLHPRPRRPRYTYRWHMCPKLVGVGDMAMAQSTIICVNGILGSSTGWEAQAAAWFPTQLPVAATGFYYWCGVFRWAQSSHADALAQLIRDSQEPVDLVAHSNGCDLVCLMLERNRDVRVRDVYLLGAATFRDCGDSFCANGVNTALANGQARRFLLGVSTADEWLGATWALPWWWGRTLGKWGPINERRDCLPGPFADLAYLSGGPAKIVEGLDDSKSHCQWTYSDCTDAFNGSKLNEATMGVIAQCVAAANKGT